MNDLKEMSNFKSETRLNMLKERTKRCVCKFCGEKLRLKRIIFSVNSFGICLMTGKTLALTIWSENLAINSTVWMNLVGSKWSIISWREWISAPPLDCNLANVTAGTPNPANEEESEE